MAKVLALYARNFVTRENERVPRQPLGPFRTEARIYREAPAGGLRITWMGHSSLLVEIDGVRLLIDPVWDERASPLAWTGPRRFYPPPLALADLPPIDAVVLSHDHYDHLGRETMRALASHPSTEGAQWVTSLGVGAILRGMGVRAPLTELNWTESFLLTSSRAAALTITALPARHFSGRSLRNRFETLWSSFVLKGERHTVYFGADSGMWDGFAEIGRAYGPFDLTMLEIGAYNKLWGDVHMGPDGAAEAFTALGGRGLLMPIHWGLFDLALHSWRQPIERLLELAGERRLPLWSPTPGSPTDVVPGEELRSEWWR
jgi:L-ascorbate metabolism protein UlaG (beta-lactamase superfamily)